jgi:hypothetical protein
VDYITVDNMEVDNMEVVVDNNDLSNTDDAKDTYPYFVYSLSSYPLVLVPYISSVDVSLPSLSVRSCMHFLLQPRTQHTSHLYPHDDNIDLLV